MACEKDKLVSVIIPVYNVKDYLSRCVDSVLSQTYNNLEIWLVDDGSTDGCSEICDEYVKNDERIRVIHKENGGLSDARNAALDAMKGDYLMFVDSDDFIHKDMISSLISILKDHDADMVFCDMIEGQESVFPPDDPNNIKKTEQFDKENRYDLLYNEKYRHIADTAWGKLYKKEVYQDIRFPKGKIHEDEFVIHHVLSKCSKIVYFPHMYYYHFERKTSITQKAYSLSRLDVVAALEDRCSFFEEYGEEQYVFLSKRDYLRKVQYHYYSLKKFFPAEKEKYGRIMDSYKKIYNDIRFQMSKADQLRYGLFLNHPSINRVIKNCLGATKV